MIPTRILIKFKVSNPPQDPFASVKEPEVRTLLGPTTYQKQFR